MNDRRIEVYSLQFTAYSKKTGYCSSAPEGRDLAFGGLVTNYFRGFCDG